MPLPLLREYVRCHIGMTIISTAHQGSVCLSVFYAEPHFHIESTRPFSFRYDNPYGFFIDFLLIFCGRFLINMTPTHFRIDMIMTEFFPIEMTELSYRNDHDLVLIWGEGKRIFYPLLSLNLSIIFLVIDTENLKVICYKWKTFS